MAGPLALETLDALRAIDTTTVYNILKGLDQATPDSYSGPELRNLFPDLGPFVGYAVTSAWTAGEDDAPNLDYLGFLEALEAMPGPTVAVLGDVSRRQGRSGIAGDGMMKEFHVLGATGAVVGGSIMDITGMERVRFPVLATGVVPAYDDLRMKSHGEPVQVGPLRIATGDLLLADRAGVIRVPVDAVDGVLRGLAGFRKLERSILDFLDRPGMTAADLRTWYEANEPEFLGGDEPSSNTIKRVIGQDA